MNGLVFSNPDSKGRLSDVKFTDIVTNAAKLPENARIAMIEEFNEKKDRLVRRYVFDKEKKLIKYYGFEIPTWADIYDLMRILYDYHHFHVKMLRGYVRYLFRLRLPSNTLNIVAEYINMDIDPPSYKFYFKYYYMKIPNWGAMWDKKYWPHRELYHYDRFLQYIPILGFSESIAKNIFFGKPTRLVKHCDKIRWDWVKFDIQRARKLVHDLEIPIRPKDVEKTEKCCCCIIS